MTISVSPIVVLLQLLIFLFFFFFFEYQVNPAELPCLAHWKRDYNMETVLLEIRR